MFRRLLDARFRGHDINQSFLGGVLVIAASFFHTFSSNIG
jgi:hypothetical protein